VGVRTIQQAFGLHELAIEDAHHAHQRPKIEAYSDSLFIGTKDLPKGPGFALYAILDFVADNDQPVVAQFGQDFDAIETDMALKWKAGYPMAVAVTALGCVLVYRRLRRAGWV
jgi:Mg2+ and Co2+ transporter CorA